MEIVSATGSTLVFIVLLVGVNISGMVQKEYGFIAAMAVFVILTSALGIKLAEFPTD